MNPDPERIREALQKNRRYGALAADSPIVQAAEAWLAGPTDAEKLAYAATLDGAEVKRDILEMGDVWLVIRLPDDWPLPDNETTDENT